MLPCSIIDQGFPYACRRRVGAILRTRTSDTCTIALVPSTECLLSIGDCGSMFSWRLSGEFVGDAALQLLVVWPPAQVNCCSCKTISLLSCHAASVCQFMR
jgi:hypothetical protein